MATLDNIQQGNQLLQNLGTFWSSIFTGSGTVKQYVQGLAQSQGQIYLDFLETTARLSRFTIPVFHTENWHQITISLNAVLGVASVYRDGDLVYGPQPGDIDNRPAGFVQTYGGTDRPGVVEVPLPPGLVDIPFDIQNFVVKPTRVWFNGIDFEIDRLRKLIIFRNDPFKDPLTPSRAVFDKNGVQIDTEIALWVYKGEFDLNNVYTQFGYALGLQLPSSQFYKDLLNAYWDMHLLGPAVNLFEQFLSALSGNPLVVNPTETVEAIWTDQDNVLVLTNLSVYQFPPAVTLIVTVGQTVFGGDALSDAVQIRELSGANPDYSILPGLSLSADYLSGKFISELTFRNQTVALQYMGTDLQGKTVVRFEVDGFPGDVDQFWGTVQANGELPGQKTLAELLDQRANPVGQPGPLNLPATINPMQFILSNLMTNNLFVIRVNQNSFDPAAPGVSMLRLLRETMPPHINYVVYVQLAPADEIFDLGIPGDDQEGGADDSAAAWFAAGPVDDEAYEAGSSPGGDVLTYQDLAVFARQLSLTCQ